MPMVGKEIYMSLFLHDPGFELDLIQQAIAEAHTISQIGVGCGAFPSERESLEATAAAHRKVATMIDEFLATHPDHHGVGVE